MRTNWNLWFSRAPGPDRRIDRPTAQRLPSKGKADLRDLWITAIKPEPASDTLLGSQDILQQQGGWREKKKPKRHHLGASSLWLSPTWSRGEEPGKRSRWRWMLWVEKAANRPVISLFQQGMLSASEAKHHACLPDPGEAPPWISAQQVPQPPTSILEVPGKGTWEVKQSLCKRSSSQFGKQSTLLLSKKNDSNRGKGRVLFPCSDQKDGNLLHPLPTINKCSI